MLETFGMELTALIGKHYPEALKGDPQQIAECTSEIATSLGGFLVFAKHFSGENGAERFLEMLIDHIVDDAEAIKTRIDNSHRTGIKPAIGN